MTEDRVVTEKEKKQAKKFYITVVSAVVALGIGTHYVANYLESEVKEGINNKINQLKEEKEVDFYGEPKADFMARPVVNLEGIAYGNQENYVAPVITEHKNQDRTWTESTLSRYIFPFTDQKLGILGVEVIDSKEPIVTKETIDTKIMGKCSVTAKARKTSAGIYKAFAADIDVKSCAGYSLLHKL